MGSAWRASPATSRIGGTHWQVTLSLHGVALAAWTLIAFSIGLFAGTLLTVSGTSTEAPIDMLTATAPAPLK